eukprot:CAMPEP_0195119598 /NCGR_PEP_ID=MMETSP0448-20130528/119840_1 /TAXON_ID=66468 /ORGANISM="Heterocapsa triquestra, Strain CCMP 448" /LENGTH=909 /DNA_ID=CAMNT_0040156943 /DNA_START=42 /DNA_END=2769 /DNA_ORIENTATION=+
MTQPHATSAGKRATGEPSASPGDAGLGLEYVYLKEYFGHEGFRSGQHEVVCAAGQGRDVAVFWATGAGKSLCYQLPALQTGKTVLIISPLISLMMDQVTKFNATAGAGQGGHRACFLGSAQVDPQVEQAALRGEYRLVYMTPEKLTGPFLQRLKPLHEKKGIALVAVDEAHCISEWGHDFRPAYRELRSIRQGLPGLPIMALTATAVPRVQADIIQQLGLDNNLLTSRSSFDRPNLKIACSRKQSKAADLERLARSLIEQPGSTIVYVPTQGDTDTVANHLAAKLSPHGIKVKSYHGGKHNRDREEAHMAFLSGQAKVIVATVSFGMGIDKPDIRRVVHYGPPKTVEEYFQQIGRAGRDGLPSVCELVAADSDFSNYSSEFYTKGLTEKAKSQMLASTDALRRYAGDACCRRRWLLEYFGEAPAFGKSCGTCDVCSATPAGGETHRDFRQAAAPVLEAIAATESFPQPLTQILPICAGNWKPKAGGTLVQPVNEALPRIRAMREALPRLMRQEAFTKELIGMLCNAGLVERRRVTLQNTGRSFNNSFDVYVLTDKGQGARNDKAAIMLPIPPAIRQQEEEQRQKAAATAKEIERAGLDPKAVPRDEIESGDGPTLWYIRKLKHWRDSGKESLVLHADRHEELRRRILAWRDEAAQRLRMAPADVLAEHLAMQITYVKPTSTKALHDVGVRIVGVEALAAIVAQAKQELFPKGDAGEEGSGVTQGTKSAMMCLPPGPWAGTKWDNAVYKQGKNGAKPPWEVSYDRWTQGETPQGIAMKQAAKPIQVGTVLGHIMQALTFAKPVDLARLFRECEMCPPAEAEWMRMEEAAVQRNLQVLGSDFRAKEVLMGVLGAEKVGREFAEKSEADKEEERSWYERIRIWEALKRCHFPATFAMPEDGEPAAKRAKTGE